MTGTHGDVSTLAAHILLTSCRDICPPLPSTHPANTHFYSKGTLIFSTSFCSDLSSLTCHSSLQQAEGNTAILLPETPQRAEPPSQIPGRSLEGEQTPISNAVLRNGHRGAAGCHQARKPGCPEAEPRGAGYVTVLCICFPD